MKICPSDNRQPSHGFTLVELLVVIVIIAALVGIGIGTMVKFRNSADKLNAGSSLRQLQLANVSYAADHNGAFVPIYSFNSERQGSYWPSNAEFLTLLFGDNEIYESNGNVDATVPTHFLDKAYVKAAGNDPNATKFFGGPYGYNHTTELKATGVGWGGKNSSGGTRITQIKNPARTAAFALCTNWILNYSGRFEYLINPTSASHPSSMLVYRFNNKVPVAFYDGHVEYLSPQDIRKFDANGGENNPFWNGLSEL